MKSETRAALASPAKSRGGARILGVALFVVFLITLGLAYALLGVERKEPIVHLVPGLSEAQVLKPNAPSEDYLRLFAAHYVTSLETYTPRTVERSHSILLGWVAPDKYAEAEAWFTETAKGIQKMQMSASLVVEDLSEAKVERVDELTYKVAIVATRLGYMGSAAMTDHRLRYEVYLRVAAPTAANPRGLYVLGTSSTPMAKEESK